jgi:hypothetical protein
MSCGQPDHYFAGYDSSYYPYPQPYVYEGALATLTYQYGDICNTDPTNNNSASNWTMVYGAQGQYVQSGYIYFYGIQPDCWRHFSQQARDLRLEPQETVLGSCVTAGERHNAWQQAIVVNNRWVYRSNIDFTIFQQSTWSPFDNWSRPFKVGFDGEVSHGTSYVPGAQWAKADQTNMQVQDWYNDQYYNTCGRVGLGGHISSISFGVDAPNCDWTRSWTNR